MLVLSLGAGTGRPMGEGVEVCGCVTWDLVSFCVCKGESLLSESKCVLCVCVCVGGLHVCFVCGCGRIGNQLST